MTEEHKKLLHDVRNKLAPILMHAQLLQMQAQKSPALIEVVDSAVAIEEAVKESIELLNKF